MHIVCKQLIKIFIITCILLLATHGQVLAQKTITLATAEHEPYIGKKLFNKGYVHELISEVFQRMGYDVKINFYPLARARLLAKHGYLDGYIPAHYDISQQKSFVFSEPFPGDNIGFLKKKNLHVASVTSSLQVLNEQLVALKDYEFGVVRGANVAPAFDSANYLKKQYVVNNIQNLDKLLRGRVDFIVGDRYTLADIMVAQRPHMIGQFDFLPSPIFSNAFHVAFSKKTEGYQQLKVDFDEGLSLLKQNGTLDNILSKHGLLPQKTKQENTIRLTIGTVNNTDMLVMRELSKQFEQIHPNIKLQWRTLSENTLRKRLLSDLAISDGQFDIMTIGSYETLLWAKRGWLSPLQNFPGNYEINDLLKRVRNLLSYQQKLYALPFYAESSMMYYRHDLFEAHGLSMPKQPTYQDIIKFAETIHNPDKEIYGICLRGKPGWGENIVALTSIVNTHAGRWFSQDWQPMLSSPAWKKSLAIYMKLITRYGPPSPEMNGFNENLKLFSNGHCGIWIDATVAASQLFDPEQSNVFDKISYTYAPVANVAEGSHWLWSWALAIPDSSKHKKEGLEFITWATSKAYVEHVAAQKGWISVPPGTRKSTYSNENYIKAAPFVSFVLQNIRDGKPLGTTFRTARDGKNEYVSIPGFHAIGDYVGSLMVNVIQGNMTQQQLLEKSQQFAEKIMEKSGYYQHGDKKNSQQ